MTNICPLSGSVFETPFVSVIIPHYNDLKRLSLCLDAVRSQNWPSDRMEVIVADNMSSQGPAAIDHIIAGRAKLVFAEEKGAGPARNCAVGAATGEILAFTDADCLPDTEWLERGVEALSGADIIGGRVDVMITHDNLLNPAEAFEVVYAFNNRHYVEKLNFTGTGNLFCHRAVFSAVGPFKVGMSEDLEWSRRAQAKGFSLRYCETAIVGHPARENWDQLLKKWARINRETFALSPPTLVHRLRFLGRAWLMPLSIIAHAPRIWRNSVLTGARDRWAALQGLVGLRLWRMIDAHRIVIGR